MRNFLRREGAPFLGLCEYTGRPDAARARSYFYDGRRSVLLYTERAQFYNRNRIRGIKVWVGGVGVCGVGWGGVGAGLRQRLGCCPFAWNSLICFE